MNFLIMNHVPLASPRPSLDLSQIIAICSQNGRNRIDEIEINKNTELKIVLVHIRFEIQDLYDYSYIDSVVCIHHHIMELNSVWSPVLVTIEFKETDLLTFNKKLDLTLKFSLYDDNKIDQAYCYKNRTNYV